RCATSKATCIHCAFAPIALRTTRSMAQCLHWWTSTAGGGRSRWIEVSDLDGNSPKTQSSRGIDFSDRRFPVAKGDANPSPKAQYFFKIGGKAASTANAPCLPTVALAKVGGRVPP